MNKTEETKLRRRLKLTENLLRDTADVMYSKIEARRTSFNDMCDVHGDLVDRMDEQGIIQTVELKEMREAMYGGHIEPIDPEIAYAEEIAAAMAHYLKKHGGEHHG